MPMLSVLFKQTEKVIVVPTLPAFEFSTDYIVGAFNHYFLGIVVNHGSISHNHDQLNQRLQNLESKLESLIDIIAKIK